MKKLIKFLKDEEGVIRIEYVIIAALIVIGIVATVINVGLKLVIATDSADIASTLWW